MCSWCLNATTRLLRVVTHHFSLPLIARPEKFLLEFKPGLACVGKPRNMDSLSGLLGD